MKKIITFILFALLLLPLNGQIGRYPFYRALQTVDSSSWESEYKKVYYAIAESGRPALDTADLQNDMVRSLKDSLLTFDRIYLFYVFAQKTAAGALINWANPGTFDLTDPGSTSPTFTVYTSYHGDGSSDYFSTGLIPATHLPAGALDSISIAVYDLEGGYNAPYTPIGVETGNNHLKIRPRVAGSQYIALNTSAIAAGSLADSKGFHIGTRRADNDIEGYFNGASLWTDTDASNALPADNFMAVLANNDDGVIEEFDPKKVAIIILLDKVSDIEARALNTIIETYMDAIGRGVQ
jgi:hypothetical protein